MRIPKNIVCLSLQSSLKQTFSVILSRVLLNSFLWSHEQSFHSTDSLNTVIILSMHRATVHIASMYSRILFCSQHSSRTPKFPLDTVLTLKNVVCSCHESPRWSKPCQPTSHSTESRVILWKESPFNRLCSRLSPFYQCFTTRKALLNKCSLAPLNGDIKPTKLDYAIWEVFGVAVVKVLQESNLLLSSECSPHSTEPRLILWDRLPIRGIFLATLHSFHQSPLCYCQQSIDIFKCPFLVTLTTFPTYLNLL